MLSLSAVKLELPTGGTRARSNAKVRKTQAGLNLKRWFKEDWRTLSGDKDYSKGDRTFRPTKGFQVKLQSPLANSLLQRKLGLEKRREKGRVSLLQGEKEETINPYICTKPNSNKKQKWQQLPPSSLFRVQT